MEKIIKAYAHDYRGIEMTEEQLEAMLYNFIDEINQEARDDHNQGEADQVKNEGYESVKDYEESTGQNEMEERGDDSGKYEVVYE